MDAQEQCMQIPWHFSVIDHQQALWWILIWTSLLCHGSFSDDDYQLSSRNQKHSSKCPRKSQWRLQMETFSALLAICAGNSPVTGEFPTQRPVTRSFDVLFDLRLNERLSKQSWGWWFETLSRPLWRHIMCCRCSRHYRQNMLHESRKIEITKSVLSSCCAMLWCGMLTL